MSGRKAIRKGKAIEKVDPYKGPIAEIVQAIDDLALVKGPTVAEYLAALERAKREIEELLDAAIEAARDDLKRMEGDEG